MDLVIFIGLQASGKSTFYAHHFAATHVLVSKDQMPNNRRPSRRQAQIVTEALAAGRSVVVDNTNPTLADRADLIALGHTFDAHVVGYWFPPDRRASLERNTRREGRARVPDVAIYVTAARLVPPTSAEGFDALYAVRIGEGGGFVVEEMPKGNANEQR